MLSWPRLLFCSFARTGGSRRSPVGGLRSEAPHTHSFGGFGLRQIDFAQSLSTSLSTAPAKPMPWRATSCPWRGLFHLKFTALAVVRKVTIRPSPSRRRGDRPSRTIDESVNAAGSRSLTALRLLVLISDKLEPRKLKSYPYRQELRHIANESLGQAVLEFFCRESALRLQRRRPVHPASVATINALLLG